MQRRHSTHHTEHLHMYLDENMTDEPYFGAFATIELSNRDTSWEEESKGQEHQYAMKMGEAEPHVVARYIFGVCWVS